MRKRADVSLVERGLAPSREKARALIKEGAVSLCNVPIVKPGQLIAPDASLTITGDLLAVGITRRLKTPGCSRSLSAN
jgi:23S rRNA (cytidine1920-2'-O)/16S rRNA (cytidine1409-2'-O)-methyltransferase